MPSSINAVLHLTNSDLSYAIVERIAGSNQFTTVTENDPSEIVPYALALLCLDEDWSEDEPLLVTHVCILTKQQRVATNQIRIKGTNIVELPKTFVSQLIKAVPNKIRPVAKRYFEHGYNKVPEKTGQALLTALLKQCPNERDAISRLILKMEGRDKRWRSRRNNDIACEKDAVGLCLDIFGVDRPSVFRSWESDNGSLGASFLNGLATYKAYEDDLINHDLHNLPGWRAVSEAIAGIVEFENIHREKLAIINANRKPLEKSMGVDLIYFHRKYEAFTLVQYKMMDNEFEEDGRKVYYNPSEKSHSREHKRMEALFDVLQQDERSLKLQEYRFCECPIFFKLCKRLQFKSEDTSIAPGAYVPLTQWNILLNDASTLGPKGGRQIGYHTLGNRYIGTKTFVDLMQRGFLGTQLLGSKRIAKFIEDALSQGHSILYAIDSRTKKVIAEDDGDDEIF